MEFIVHSAMPSVFRRIALVGKLRSPEIDAAMRELRAFLAKRGCEVLEGETRADLAIVIGGDGTMLAAARELVRHHVPLVGNGDVHRLSQLGRTWSEVDVDVPETMTDAEAAAAICGAIRAGRVRAVTAPIGASPVRTAM